MSGRRATCRRKGCGHGIELHIEDAGDVVGGCIRLGCSCSGYTTGVLMKIGIVFGLAIAAFAAAVLFGGP